MFFFLGILILETFSHSEVSSQNVIEINSENFQEVLRSHHNLLVHFYAKWCAHCRKFEPRFETVANTLLNNHPHISLGKIDIDENPSLAEAYNIVNYPSLKFFKSGKIYDYTSDRDEENMVNWLVKHSKEIVRDITNVEELNQFKENRLCFVMFGKKNTEEFQKFYKAAEKAEGSFYGVFENFESLNFPDNEPRVIVYKKYDDRFGVFHNFDRLDQFFEKNQDPWVMPLNHKAIEKVFKHKQPALFVFTKEKNIEDSLNLVSSVIRGNLLIVYGDVTSPQHLKLASGLGISHLTLPFSMIISENYEKYIFDGEISNENLIGFYQNWKNRKAKRFYKSEVSNFASKNGVLQLDSEKFENLREKEDLLVLFWVPDCGYCRLLEPDYEEVGKKIKSVSVASLDYSKNELKDISFSEFPKLVFYSKGTTKGIEYQGEWNSESIIKFVNNIDLYRQNSDKTDL